MINKQLTKGYKMRKIAMVIGILSILATNAQAEYWTSLNNDNCPPDVTCCYW